MIAKLKGYPLTCVMPENATEERKRLLRLYGAEIVLSPGAEGSNGAVRLALELAERDPKYFMPFQYANPANPRAHYEGTGAEIAEALDRVDVLVAGLGTGGTLMGAGERLRESFPDIVIAAAEPLPGDSVMGLRSLDDGYVPPILDVTKLDRKMLVSNEESVHAVRALLDLEGIFAGVSCGAAVHVARRIAEELDEGVIVVDPRRRRLEVHLRGLLGGLRRATSRSPWNARSGGRPGREERVGDPADVRAALVAHANAELPNEACGLVLFEDDVAVEYVPGENVVAVALPLRARASTRSRGPTSTTATSCRRCSTRTSPRPPRPSRTDVENIGLWAGQPYLIYTLRTDELAAWRIVDRSIEPIPLRTG